MSRMSIIFALVFIVILGALAAAGYFMLRRGGQSESADSSVQNKRMVRALTVRIGVSVVLFICVLLAWKLGYINPTGLPVGR
ncbi:MAG: DUF2909 domain-containing protein [Brachymonas sp.]|nr:DUF2909 domain-containing protein [Brachymonas sp.]